MNRSDTEVARQIDDQIGTPGVLIDPESLEKERHLPVQRSPLT